MQDKHLFEYAVIRIVPKVEREEFLNVGVIVYCAKQRFLQADISLNEARAAVLWPELDMEEVKGNLASLQRIAAGGKDAGPIGRMDAASRFRWLTATRSTVVQTSRVHPGLCADGGQALGRLFAQLVL